MKPLSVVLLCGGPSPERGISLNSARSAYDHLTSDEIQVSIVYYDYMKRPYLVSPAQLYSNTPSDFDFKLRTTARPLSQRGLLQQLRSVDLVFPVMHGAFGEDGTIQRFLEQHEIRFVGSDSAACRRCFDKFDANEFLRAEGFHALPSIVVTSARKADALAVKQFFRSQRLKRAVVKPANGGSSIGVYSVSTPEEALQQLRVLLRSGYRRVVIEPFCEGREFTVVILENRVGTPVSLFPIEIEADYTKHQIFDYRKKYLPTRQVTYHCPPRFSAAMTNRIRTQAAQLFRLFGMRDCARFDGWVLNDGSVWFSDFNPISGMEQNSFLFLQASQIGMSHGDTLRTVLASACRRYGIKKPLWARTQRSSRKKRVSVLFGGSSAERQVSVMSGTNVWLKLRRSSRYAPEPFLLDPRGNVWRLPYNLTLNHTVEEIAANCEAAQKREPISAPLREQVLLELMPSSEQVSERLFAPERMPLKEFVKQSEFIFNTVHGGIGEDGTLQRMFQKARVPFNGCGSKASALCMDKFESAVRILPLEELGVHTARKVLLDTKTFGKLSADEMAGLWHDLCESFGAHEIVAKPPSDGCSAGIVVLSSADELKHYMKLLLKGTARIPAGSFARQRGIVEMPTAVPATMMFEEFITTDEIVVRGNTLRRTPRSGWVEVTVGVIGSLGAMRALNPSITVASGAVLSVEEKFQGVTGINITPPPSTLVSDEVLEIAKRRIELIAEQLGIEGYARIDAFMELASGRIIFIEANSLPALTPSTVLFHQALVEEKPMIPRELLEHIVALGEARRG